MPMPLTEESKLVLQVVQENPDKNQDEIAEITRRAGKQPLTAEEVLNTLRGLRRRGLVTSRTELGERFARYSVNPEVVEHEQPEQNSNNSNLNSVIEETETHPHISVQMDNADYPLGTRVYGVDIGGKVGRIWLTQDVIILFTPSPEEDAFLADESIVSLIFETPMIGDVTKREQFTRPDGWAIVVVPRSN